MGCNFYSKLQPPTKIVTLIEEATVLNAAFIKAISEMLGKSKPKDTSSLAGSSKGDFSGGRPLNEEELLGKRVGVNPDSAFSRPLSGTAGLQEQASLRGGDTPGFKGILNKEIQSSLSTPFNQPLKIAVLHRNFDPTAGGAEHYAVALVEELAHLHEFHVFAQKIDHHFPGVTYHQVPHLFVRPRWLNQLLYAAYCAWATRRAQGFDIVHSHENTWSGNVQTVHVMPLTHNLFAGKSTHQKALQWLKVCISPRLLCYVALEKLRLTNKPGRWFICVSEPLHKILKYSLGCSPQAMMTIPPGVHVKELLSQGARALRRLQARERLGLPEHARCLLWVGHDAQKKGLDTALNALALLPSDYVLIIAGAAKPREFWAHLVRNKVSERVLEKGVVNAQVLSELFEACDLLIHPTKEDTFGMVVLEAMAQGLPVIVSGAQYCGISAELTDHETALILQSPEDPVELAGKVVLALQGLMADLLSTQAQEWAKTQDWSRMAELQNTVYTHIAYAHNNQHHQAHDDSPRSH